jgi:hypothetical protein
MNLSPEIVIVSGDKSTLIRLNLRPVFGEDYSQTVAFAMSVRAERIGNPIDASNRVLAAGKETSAIAKDLWEIAIKECDQPVQPSQMTMKFATKIFDWVTQHLKD